MLTGESVAESWEFWCGCTAWSRAMRSFGNLGGMVTWYCGYPQSSSAIPLCFGLCDGSGHEIVSGSRLKDIKAAVEILKNN